MRHFLHVAGYVHIKGVFTADEVGRYGAEVEHVRALTTPGDPYSWWSINADGEEVVTRINYLGRHSRSSTSSTSIRGCCTSRSWPSPDLRVCDDRLDGPMVFVKHSNVVKGNGDLGWHVDDGIGGHPVMCPLIQTGIQLDHANPANGQLLVLAGSHRYTSTGHVGGRRRACRSSRSRPSPATSPSTTATPCTPRRRRRPTAPDAERCTSSSPSRKTFEWVPGRVSLQRRPLPGRRPRPVANRATTWDDAKS